jgi:8-oxo-dGTP pyrophosphatase MutT (NUDIX family)
MQLAIHDVERRLIQHRPRSCWWRPFGRQSSVALILREGSTGLEVLMIRRAEHPADPWSGQMAFPGGRRDPGDSDLLAVACRETYEEIGVDLMAKAVLLAPLSVLRARPWLWKRRPMTVSPFVFLLNQDIEVVPNYEVADVIWVPLGFIADRINRQTFDFQRQGIWYRNLPCYEWQQQRIWGMSLHMLDELVDVLSR